MPNETTNTTNESPTAGNQADRFSALRAAIEAGTGSIIMVLVSIGVIVAAFNSHGAKAIFEKVIDFLKDAKGLTFETKAYAAALIQKVWPLIRWRLRQLGWSTIVGSLLALVLVWLGHPVGAAWVILGLGIVWCLISFLIYIALTPLRTMEFSKEWQLALSRPFAAVAMLIGAISILVMALPEPFRNASVFALVTGTLLLFLSYSVFWGKEKSEIAFYGAVTGLAVISVFGIAMAAFPATRDWLDATATQKSMLLGLEADKAADQYTWYRVTVAGKLLTKEGKPLTLLDAEGNPRLDEKGNPFVDPNASLKKGDIVKVDISLKKTNSFPGIGTCRTVYVCKGTEVLTSGEFPLQGLEKVLVPEAEGAMVVAASPAKPANNAAGWANLLGYFKPSSLVTAGNAPDLSQTKFRGKVGNDWVNTGLIVYPEDRVTWGPFDDKLAEKVVGGDGNFLFQFSQAVRIPAAGESFECFPNQSIVTPRVQGGAGAYVAFTTFWENENGFPMLVRYTGEGEVDVTLLVERNVLKVPERRDT